MFLENINDFVITFFSQNTDNEYLESLWMSPKNQQLLLKTIKKTNIKIKDPNKPKRGKSGFLYFCEENREKIKNEHPSISVKEIVSKLGQLWQYLKKTNKEEIKRYEDLSISDRIRYKNQMKEYVPLMTRKKDKSPKEKKVKSKRSILFDNYIKSKKLKTKRQHPELDSHGIITYLTEKWEKLPEEKKNRYVTVLYRSPKIM
jgi:hypothetical protein